MDNRLKKILIIAAVATYVIAPDLLPGPVDDIIATLIGAGALKKTSTCKGGMKE